MNQISPQPANRLDPATTIGWTALTIADLERSVQFYTEVLGFGVLQQQTGVAVLGVEATPLLVLVEQPGARPRSSRTTGLFHFAILVPSRLDLGRSLRQLVTAGYPLDGASDHLVSEALYLSDPDNNGIEIYCDRPRDQWSWTNGQVAMASDPVDLAGLLQDAERDGRSQNGLAAGTGIGHMHLQVADIQQAEAFYHGVLGFDVVARWPGALFVSAGGYHHHIGLNTWSTRGAPQPVADAAGLRMFTIAVPNDVAKGNFSGRLQGANVTCTEDDHALAFDDPWHNRIFVVRSDLLAGAVALAIA